MQCARCQYRNSPQANFCEQCGAALARTCSNCGTLLPLTAKFCHECAHPVAIGNQSHIGPADRYTPKHLAKKILISKSALEGERKQVTVLLADLKNSMELLADRDPEEARKILDPVLELMMEAVHYYEGTVNQVMGDGIMALFGAPVAHEDHAVRACYSALRMQQRVRQYSDESKGAVVRIRIGLNSGDVVVRSIGNDLHMDYTAVGHTTHLAGRMEQMAQPGSVFVTAETIRLVEGYVEVKPLGPMPVKGLEVPIEVYELVGAAPVRSRLEAAAARGFTRFVGREAELEVMRQALDRVYSGHGQVSALVGEPGVGKSRLFREFIQSPRMHGWLVLEGSSASYGKAIPYLPIIDFLKRYFHIERRDDASKVQEKLLAKLLTLDRAMEPALPAFCALLDVPVKDPTWDSLDASRRHQRTQESLKRLLLRESQVQPVCLGLEDLHWIDSETQELLDTLVDSLPTARLLLLVNYRPEYQHSWGNKTGYTHLRINPLPPENCEELLHALLGSDPGLEQLKQRLIVQTDGNPFFLEESVRTLVETKVLVGEGGTYRLAKALPVIQTPTTVQAVLAARIDRLPADEKRLLQAAAVIGEAVPFVLLQAIAEQPEESLRRSLRHLQAAEFLYETHLFPDLEYSFKHGLTYQVAYGSILHDGRRALHARILEAIERLYSGSLTEHIGTLAHHAFRGCVWEKALLYLRLAGTKAASASAYREAVAYFEQAITALKHLPERPGLLEQSIDLRFDLRTFLLPLGEFTRILGYLHEAEELATASNDDLRLGRVRAYLTECLRQSGRYDSAIEYGRQALAIAESRHDVGLEVATNIYFSQIYHNKGEYRRASAFLTTNLKLLTGALVHESFGLPYIAAVHTRTWLAWCLVELGAFTDALSKAEEALHISQAPDLSSAPSFASAYSALGRVLLRQGHLDRAIVCLERGLHLTRASDLHLWFAHFLAELGHAYALAGRIPEALPLLQQAVEQWNTIRGTAGQAFRLVSLSEAHLLAGRADDALRFATQALDLARTYRERGYHAYALRALAESASHQKPIDADHAQSYYREALRLSEELEMQPLLAHSHFGLGRFYRSQAEHRHADEHFILAADLFRSMDMPLWSMKVELELKDLRLRH